MIMLLATSETRLELMFFLPPGVVPHQNRTKRGHLALFMKGQAQSRLKLLIYIDNFRYSIEAVSTREAADPIDLNQGLSSKAGPLFQGVTIQN